METRKIGGMEPSMLGYGCMRFPVDRETNKIDEAAARALIRRAMEGGITYYDTAWPYHNGESEAFLGRALAEYPRSQYYLATKLPCWEIDSREEAQARLAAQLERLNTRYVDFYLLHSLSRKTWDKMVQLQIPALLEEWQRQGKVRRLGFSFHDAYPVLEEILRFRSWDFCQIQLNYMDTEYQAGLKGLALAREMGVPVVVMEPVKGGSLAQLPAEVAQPLKAFDPEASPASWALRWAASQPGVSVVLSGMSDTGQLEENLSTFSPLRPLNPAEEDAVQETARRLRRRIQNGCTGCRYCMPCPAGVDIPKSFQIWNNMSMYQNAALTRRAWEGLEAQARPDRCVGCGRCEEACPQHLSIREDLARAQAEIRNFAASEAEGAAR